MDRTEASIAPARGGDRTDRGHRCRVPADRWLGMLGLGALRLGLLALVGTAVGVGWAAPTAEAAGTPHSSKPALTLLAPPTIAGPAAPFSVRLGVPATVARADLTLGVTVYRALRNPTEFDETLGGSPVGSVIAGPRVVAVSSLPSDAVDQAGVDLTVPVTAGGVTGTGAGAFTVDLPCQLGSCGGVYPVRLELTNTTSDTVVSRLLTYLVYTDPSADIEPLRFALVVPLGLASASVPPSATPAVTSSGLDTLTGLMDAVSGAAATVPLTFAPSPAAVAALSADGRSRSKAALTSLVSLTAQPDRQTLCGPFVALNASAVVTSALGGSTELADQIHRGTQVLQSLPALRTNGCPAGNAWVSDTTIDPAALGALAALGYTDVVVPPSAVAGPAPSTTPTRRFTLVGGSKSGNAILSDPGLSSLLQPTPRTDPALAADQLLAELELDYYEAPNTQQARGVVAVPAAGGHANPTVVADVLAGLQHNPMVAPVTLATLFSEVPVGGSVGGVTQPGTRRPAAVGNTTGLPVRAISAARARLTGFAAVVAASTAGTAVATALDDLLLASESQQLTASQQRAAVGHVEDAINQKLALLSITSREVRLTASTGSVPITVLKNAPYPVEAVLTVTSDKIAFSAGGAQASNAGCRAPVVTSEAGRSSVSTQCVFVHGTNAVYIEMRSRVSGDFRMSVTLDSPQGGLQLASGQITVRALSTSAVAIALTVAAGAVLLGWWGRTMWRNRRTRRGAHRVGAGGGP